MSRKHPDARVIAKLGGPAELARKLGFDPAKGGVQRIQNWKDRGIPVLIKYEHPEIFGEPPAKARKGGSAEAA